MTSQQAEYDRLWLSKFNALKEYRRKHGHCIISRRRDEQNSALACWVDKQRIARRKGKLLPERFQKLEKLGLQWNNTYEEEWEERFQWLKDHVKRTGSFRVPEGKNRVLHAWVKRQRNVRRKGKLHEDRMKELDAIGFPWEIDGPSKKQKLSGAPTTTVSLESRLTPRQILDEERRQKQWERKFEELQEHVESTGSFCVSKTANKQLSVWLCKQRSYRRKGMLSGYRINKLSEIGFPWEVGTTSRKQTPQAREVSSRDQQSRQSLGEERRRKGWEERLQEVQGHVQRTGSFYIPERENKLLADWIHKQRYLRRLGNLSDDKVKKLNEIEFPWETGSISRKRKAQGEGDGLNSHATQAYPVGTKVCKQFGSEYYSGRVTEFDEEYGWYRVVYEDDDWAEYSEEELREIVVPEEERAANRPEDSDVPASASAGASLTDPELTSMAPACGEASDGIEDTREDTRIVADSATSSDVSWKYPMGTRVRKRFRGYGWFNGEVAARFAPDYYRVLYCDGDFEDYREVDLEGILLPSSTPVTSLNI